VFAREGLAIAAGVACACVVLVARLHVYARCVVVTVGECPLVGGGVGVVAVGDVQPGSVVCHCVGQVLQDLGRRSRVFYCRQQYCKGNPVEHNA
jgi:hypothetical protein